MCSGLDQSPTLFVSFFSSSSISDQRGGGGHGPLVPPPPPATSTPVHGSTHLCFIFTLWLLS